VQAGEIIWFLAGIGLGLTLAMGLLAVMALLDRSRGSADPEEIASPEDAGQQPMPVPRRKVRPVPEPMLLVPEDRKPASRPFAPLSPPPPRAPVTLDSTVVERPAKSSDLAEEIARMQASAAEQPVEPPSSPAPVIAAPASPAAEPEPAAPAAAAKPADDALAELTSPVEPPAAPKVPPLPKVTPARKFAPALPPKPPGNTG